MRSNFVERGAIRKDMSLCFAPLTTAKKRPWWRTRAGGGGGRGGPWAVGLRWGKGRWWLRPIRGFWRAVGAGGHSGGRRGSGGGFVGEKSFLSKKFLVKGRIVEVGISGFDSVNDGLVIGVVYAAKNSFGDVLRVLRFPKRG